MNPQCWTRIVSSSLLGRLIFSSSPLRLLVLSSRVDIVALSISCCLVLLSSLVSFSYSRVVLSRPFSCLSRLVLSCPSPSSLVSSCARLVLFPQSSFQRLVPNGRWRKRTHTVQSRVLPGHLGSCPAIAHVRPNPIHVDWRGCYHFAVSLHAFCLRLSRSNQSHRCRIAHSFGFMLRPSTVIPLSPRNRPSR